MASYTYTLDGVGNRTKLEEADGSITTWKYDDAYRLLHEERQAGSNAPAAASWNHHFTYDAVGNRTSMTDMTGGATAVTTYTYTANKVDQLEAVTLADGTRFIYQYDQRGNLLSDGVTAYQYDAADQLVGVTEQGQTEQYAYDADGRRISRTIDGTTTTFLWDEASRYGDVVAEIDAAGNVQTSYTLGQTSVLGQTRGGTTQNLLQDGQGSTRILVGTNQTATEHYLYDAFGQLRDGPAAPQTTYLYTGQQLDKDTGLYYLRARSYNPTDGRFLTRDTFYQRLDDPSELNRYGYIANNPINGIDPTGHMFVEYAGANKNNEEQAAARARYINGYTLATGPAKWGLLAQSLLSMATDMLIIGGINSYVPRDAKRLFTIGLGTIWHLKTNTQTKVFSVSNDNWPSLDKAVGGWPFAWLGSFTSSIQGPGISVHFIAGDGNSNPFDDWFDQFTHKGHAEMKIARWSLGRYGAYPTPHRVLDIATNNFACVPTTKWGNPTKWGNRACNLQLPKLWTLHPLLFETTQFPYLR